MEEAAELSHHIAIMDKGKVIAYGTHAELIKMVGERTRIDLTLNDWDAWGKDVPTIVNLMPSGKYLMEEFFYAGGIPAVIKRLGEAGAKITRPPGPMKHGTTVIAFVEDPDGYKIELIER